MRIRLLTAGALVVLCGAIVIGQTPDPQTLGPQVGDRVPDFRLPDQNGRARTLQSTFGPKGAVLVFFRSADW